MFPKYSASNDLCPSGLSRSNGGIGRQGELECPREGYETPSMCMQFLLFGQLEYNGPLQVLGMYLDIEEAKLRLDDWVWEEETAVNSTNDSIDSVKEEKAQKEAECALYSLDGCDGYAVFSSDQQYGGTELLMPAVTDERRVILKIKAGVIERSYLSGLKTVTDRAGSGAHTNLGGKVDWHIVSVE